MRSAIWLFLSPFAMIGGMLVGWFGHAVKLAEGPLDTYLLDNFDFMMMLIGVGLIVLGGAIRSYMMARMKRQLRAQDIVLAVDRQKIETAQASARIANRRLDVIRELIAGMPDERIRRIVSEEEIDEAD